MEMRRQRDIPKKREKWRGRERYVEIGRGVEGRKRERRISKWRLRSKWI